MNTSPKSLVTTTATILVLSGTILLLNISPAAAATGTFTEWDTIAALDAAGNPTPVRDFDPHITDLDRTGNTGFTANTPWYTIDNRFPSPPCALLHLEPGTNTLISWGIGSGVPIGIDVDDASGRVWWTVSGSISGVSGAHVAFKGPGAASDSFTHFPGTSNGAGIVVDSAGNAYYAEIGTTPDRITKITPAGALFSWILPSSVVEPRYLIFNSDETKLYFTTSRSRDINELTLATNGLRTWDYPTAPTLGTFSILDTYGIFRQSDEAIWYADTIGDKVARLNPSTNIITEFTKAGMDGPEFLVVSSADQVFITERFGNTVDIMEIEGGTDTEKTPSSKTLTTTSSTVTPNTFDRTRLSRVIDPVVTDVTGIDPPAIDRFPLPTANSGPIGITDVVEAVLADVKTFGIFGGEFGSPGNSGGDRIFLFESEIILPPTIGHEEIKKEIIEIENKLNNPDFGLEEIKKEVIQIEEKLDGDRQSLILVIVDGINNIINILLDPQFGLQEIKTEIIDIQTTLDDPNFGLEHIKSEIIEIELKLDHPKFVRDNVIVHGISLEENERLIIVDNAGIGGTSDVEVTMRSSDDDDDDTCTIQILVAGAWTDLALSDFPVATVDEVNRPQHGDALGVEAVSLFGGTDGCEIDDDSEYVAVSTVGSTP